MLPSPPPHRLSLLAVVALVGPLLGVVASAPVRGQGGVVVVSQLCADGGSPDAPLNVRRA
jgi:hypothetical protein